jgi:hypothetical protein
MGKILVPTTSHEDWQRLLAKPDLHWKAGRSAMTLARSWESANGNFPPEIQQILVTAGRDDWREIRLLLAVPEYQVPLPGGSRASQTDLLVLARGERGLVAIAVEGKVDESLGPTIEEKAIDRTKGFSKRLAYLCSLLRLGSGCLDEIRYQLLHRTASALIAAKDFAAESAVMLVHSFSPTSLWFPDFQAFVRLYGRESRMNELVDLGDFDGIRLHVGWCSGDPQWLKSAEQLS